jgi:hypothetical protein
VEESHGETCGGERRRAGIGHRHSDGSEEQRFELQTAKDYDKPVLGVKVYADDPFLPSWTITR